MACTLRRPIDPSESYALEPESTTWWNPFPFIAALSIVYPPPVDGAAVTVACALVLNAPSGFDFAGEPCFCAASAAWCGRLHS